MVIPVREDDGLATAKSLGGKAINAHHDSSNLDFLRSVAVLFVVTSHLVPNMTAAGESFYHWQGLGILGVALFFVHTCLVLMLSLQRQRETFGTRSLELNFLLRRFFRIYPLSMVIVCLSFGLASVGLAPQEAPFTLRCLVSNLALAQNLMAEPPVPGVTWSLPFEVQMYLVLPVLFALVFPDLRRGRLIVAGLWGMSVVAIVSASFVHLNYHLIKWIPCFLPGVLAFTLLSRPRSLPFYVLPGTLIAAGLVFPVLVKLRVPETFLSWLVCLPLGFLLPHVREVASPMLVRGARALAKYSYGIYLTHAWAIWFSVTHLSGSGVLAQLVAIALIAAMLAFLAYHLVEAPGIRLGKRVVARWMALAQVQATVIEASDPRGSS